MDSVVRDMTSIYVFTAIVLLMIGGASYYSHHKNDGKYDDYCKIVYGQEWDYTYEYHSCRTEATKCLVYGSGNVTDVCESTFKYKGIISKIIETGV